MQQTRIFLATQHQTLYQGLARLLETEVTGLVVGGVVGRIPAESELQQANAHLLILDIRLLSPATPDPTALRQSFPNIKIVLYAEADLTTAPPSLPDVDACTPRSLDSEELLTLLRRFHAARYS